MQFINLSAAQNTRKFYNFIHFVSVCEGANECTQKTIQHGNYKYCSLVLLKFIIESLVRSLSLSHTHTFTRSSYCLLFTSRTSNCCCGCCIVGRTHRHPEYIDILDEYSTHSDYGVMYNHAFSA